MVDSYRGGFEHFEGVVALFGGGAAKKHGKIYNVAGI